MAQNHTRPTSGMILGKFMPPHKGHQYLFDFARSYVDTLHVLVCSLEREPIPGGLRFRWVREMLPDCKVHHHTQDIPQTPEEHPEFWPIWLKTIRSYLPQGPDYVFASEDYGQKLAEILGAVFVPVDCQRELVPVSGTAIRQRPLQNWEYLPEPVRPYYCKRVCIFGPESTGKSTLTRDLAKHYQTKYVHEYARPLLDPQGGRCEYKDIERIARGHHAAEEALQRQANRVLFSDTDALTTTIWSNVLFGKCPDYVQELAATQKYNLTLLLDIDVPWVDDDQRFFPQRRHEFFDRCQNALKEQGRTFVRIAGDWDTRWKMAIRAVDQLLEDGDVFNT